MIVGATGVGGSIITLLVVRVGATVIAPAHPEQVEFLLENRASPRSSRVPIQDTYTRDEAHLSHHRPMAGDTAGSEAIKLTARTHEPLIWDRTRPVLQLRSTLGKYFPVALQTLPDLNAHALELLTKAPDPDSAARLSTSVIAALNT